jgi:hypothetical protein
VGDAGLSEAVERLRAVFARYPARGEVVGCPCCVSGQDVAALREGSDEALERYAYKAMTTWGDADDFRHHLPRLLAASGPDGIDLGILAGKLRYAHWQTWAEDEQAAIRAYLTAMWRDAITAEPAFRVVGLLDDLIDVDLDAGVLLDMLYGPASGLEVIAELVRVHLYVSDRDAAVPRWLAGPRTKKALEDGFFAAESAEHADMLSTAVQQLEWQTAD